MHHCNGDEDAGAAGRVPADVQCDIYDFLAGDDRLSISVVRSLESLRGALRKDGWMFDMCIIADVKNADVAAAVCRKVAGAHIAWHRRFKAQLSHKSTSSSGSSFRGKSVDSNHSSGAGSDALNSGKVSSSVRSSEEGASKLPPRVVFVLHEDADEAERIRVLQAVSRYRFCTVLPFKSTHLRFDAMITQAALARADALLQHDVLVDSLLSRYREALGIPQEFTRRNFLQASDQGDEPDH